LRPLLSDFGVDAETEGVRIVLPVASLPKGPVIDFDVTVGGQPAHMLPRLEIADLEAAFLQQLANEAALPADATVWRLLPLVCGFTSGPWDQVIADFTDVEHALLPYLNDGVGEGVTAALAQEWLETVAPAGQIVRTTLASPGDPRSAVENPVLCVPDILAAGIADDLASVTPVLRAYSELLRAASREAASSESRTAASDFLLVLSDYGSFWDLMVSAVVPLDDAFVVKTHERRTLQIAGRPKRGQQSVVLADARTNHITLRLGDPNVELTDVVLKDTDGEDLGFLLAAAGEQDPEVFSFYVSDPERDFRGVIDFGLQPTGPVRTIGWVFCGIVIAPLAVLLTRGHVGSGELGVLVVPSTFAASLLLVRDPSSLGRSIRQAQTYLLAFSLTLLWLVVLSMFLLHKIKT
jgi:hypothetical protein